MFFRWQITLEMAGETDEEYYGYYITQDDEICNYYLQASSVPYVPDTTPGMQKKITIVGSGNW